MNTGLSDAIVTYIETLGPQANWAIGKVTAVAAPTVTVSMLGDTFQMHYLISYAVPTVNDIVLVLTGGGQQIVIGQISH